MALEIGAQVPQAEKTRVHVSELFELNFALFLDKCGDDKREHRRPAWMAAFLRDHPDLYARIADFWDSPGYHAWDEMLLVAYHTDTILDESLDRFFERLPGALAREIPVPALPSETPDVPGIVAERLERLRTSPELRERYVALLGEAWAVIGPLWNESGRPAAIEAARTLRLPAPTLDGLRRVLPGVTMLRREQHEALIQSALERNEVIILPLWLAGDGQFLFALPGLLYIGFGLESGRKLELRREESEKTAACLKLLSDPTRVAIVRQLMHDSFTITDLANYFELSQPTVSVHMKALREAELLEAEKIGNQTRYRVAGARVWQYVTDALALIGVAPAS